MNIIWVKFSTTLLLSILIIALTFQSNTFFQIKKQKPIKTTLPMTQPAISTNLPDQDGSSYQVSGLSNNAGNKVTSINKPGTLVPDQIQYLQIAPGIKLSHYIPEAYGGASLEESIANVNKQILIDQSNIKTLNDENIKLVAELESLRTEFNKTTFSDNPSKYNDLIVQISAKEKEIEDLKIRIIELQQDIISHQFLLDYWK